MSSDVPFAQDASSHQPAIVRRKKPRLAAERWGCLISPHPQRQPLEKNEPALFYTIRRESKKGRIGERYILGGEDLSLREILTEIAAIVGRKPPRISLPRAPLFPLAYATEWLARLRKSGEPMLTVDSLRMSRKRMFFSSAKAENQLGYTARPALEALRDAIQWFRDNRYL